MSFVVDDAKVAELLSSSNPGYTVSITPIAPTTENFRSYYDSMGVSGTVVVDRATTSKEARGHLMALREKIEKSGAPLQSAAALTRDIEETRGRSR